MGLFTSGTSDDQRQVLLAKQILGLTEALEMRVAGGRLHVAVDFSEIHGYVLPPLTPFMSERLAGDSSLEEQVALTYLFEEFPKARNKLILLPPYRTELDAAIRMKMIRLLSNYQQGPSYEDLLRIKNAVISSYKVDDEKGNIVDVDKALELLKKHFFDLYVALTVGAFGLRDFERMDKYDAFAGIETIRPEFGEPAFLDEIAARAESRFLSQIQRSRKRSQSSNFFDAKALQLIVDMNRRINGDGEAVVLISRSGPSGWPVLAPSQVIVRTGDVQNEVSVRQVLHPVALYLYTLFGDDADFKGTIARLKGILDFTTDIASSYSSLDQISGKGSDEAIMKLLTGRVTERLRVIQQGLGSFENLEGLSKIEGCQAINVRRIVENIKKARASAREKYAERVKMLTDAATQGDRLEEALTEVREEVKKWCRQAIDLASLRIASGVLLPVSPARYLFGETDFRDPSVRRMCHALSHGAREEFGQVLQSLYDLRDRIENQGFEEGSDDEVCYWDARLLIAQLKERTKNYVWAWRDTMDGLLKSPGEYKPLFHFLQNVVLSRKSAELDDETKMNANERLEVALREANHLVESYGGQSPRYALQHGYLLWMGAKIGIPDCRVSDAKNATLAALRQASTNLEENRTCYRLALCNLVIHALQEHDVEKAESLFQELRDDIGEGEHGQPFFYYVESEILLKRIELATRAGSSAARSEFVSKLCASQDRRIESAAKLLPVSEFTQSLYREQDRAIASIVVSEQSQVQQA